MRTPHDPRGGPTRSAADDAPVGADELFIGELTAALAAEAGSADDALPPAMAVLATQAGEAFVRGERRAAAEARAAAIATDSVMARRSASNSAPRNSAARSPLRTLAIWGGWLATAAVLALWTIDNRSRTAPEGGDALVTQPVQTPGEALRDSLLVADPALTRVAFAGTDDPTAVGASGEVLWSGAAQRGVMRIVGLQPNDRAVLQYQLWIFDKNRDARYPVDGGVFDIPAGATEVLVPISARIPVGEASLFAVTVEPPGGVVVSTRERVALLAEL